MLSVVSYGGGVQSTALLVMAARGEIEARVFAFARVGSDSENPATLRYVEDYVIPYAAAHDIELVGLDRVRASDGSVRTLYDDVLNDKLRSIPIPVRMPDTGKPGNRRCTVDFKIDVVAKFLRLRGATREAPASLLMGISLDEFHRMRRDDLENYPYIRKSYPLIDRRLDRASCLAIVEREGLPVPPKSSCWFCPFHSARNWSDMKHDNPALFARAVEFERALNDKRVVLGLSGSAGYVYLHSGLRPLAEAVGEYVQMRLDDVLDDGVCVDDVCMV